MRRDPLPWLLVLFLVLLASIAWLTRYPDSPVLDRLAELPVIGPAADWFRDTYRPASPAAPPAPVEEEEPLELVVVGRQIPDAPGAPPTSRPLGRVWIRAGAQLREGPDPDSAVVGTVAGIRTMTLMERRGDWSRVSRVGLKGTYTEGWVRQTDLGKPSADELWQPEPVVPLPAVSPPEEIIAQARELMGGDAREVACGPFRLITDVEGPVVRHCPRLAGQLDGLYAGRTGLEPVGEPAEAALLFDSHGAYMIFRTRVSPESRRQAFASPAQGFVAMASGGQLTEQVQATLVHELVHLLNRRFLGPALPPWLDEGLADELAMSRIAEDGTLSPASLGHWESGPDGARLIGGGLIELAGLRTRMRRGDLPTLETLSGLDRESFQAEESFQTHYSLSAFWVRYLLSERAPSGGGGFRLFLSAVAEGKPLGGELLLTSLGTDWPELETGFRRWLDEEAGQTIPDPRRVRSSANPILGEKKSTDPPGLYVAWVVARSTSGSSSRQAELPSA